MIITLFYARLNGNYLCLELQLNGNYDRLQRIAIHNRQKAKEVISKMRSLMRILIRTYNQVNTYLYCVCSGYSTENTGSSLTRQIKKKWKKRVYNRIRF